MIYGYRQIFLHINYIKIFCCQLKFNKYYESIAGACYMPLSAIET